MTPRFSSVFSLWAIFGVLPSRGILPKPVEVRDTLTGPGQEGSLQQALHTALCTASVSPGIGPGTGLAAWGAHAESTEGREADGDAA